MAQDIFGNYVVGITTPAVSPLPSSMGGSQELYSDIWADPNGHITPDDPTLPARYEQDPAIDLYSEWKWDVDNQVWVQYSGV